MILAVIASLAVVLSNSAEPSSHAKVVEVSAPAPAAADLHPDRYEQFPAYDVQDEKSLLQLTNRDRERAGRTPLRLDPALTSAARAHAALMAKRGELSHQFSDEPPLQERTSTVSLHLDKVGENVALDSDIAQAHDGLMHSPHHRENLLRAEYNVVGLGVARIGGQIYVVEDFGHSLPTYAVGQTEDIIASTIEKARGQGATQLQRRQAGVLHTAACDMATKDHLNPHAVSSAVSPRYALTFTSMQPESLPSNIGQVLGDRSVRSYAVGACYAHTPTYPNGAYFVTVAFF